MFRRSILLALLVLVAPALASAQAPTAPAQPPTVESLRAMLSGFEHGPGAADWAAIGPGAVPLLATIAGDSAQPGFVRLRAIQAARHFATAESRAMLRRALRSSDPLFVREAALAMQRAFGAESLGELAPLLDHRDTVVREAAIRAVGAIARDPSAGGAPPGTADAPLRGGGAPSLRALGPQQLQAREHLRSRLVRERDEVLREEIERQLSGVGGSSSG